MILKLENIKYLYPDGFEALCDVNAEIENKSFVVILGESGSGKTTLFRVITGISDPIEGSIFINDQDVTKATTSSRDLTMIFQNFVLYPHMTLYENVLTGLNGFGLSDEEQDVKTKQILTEFGLRDYLNFKPRHVSDGQKQRVAMCKALVREPSLFLMDEPLSNLDLPQRVRIKQELKQIYEKRNSTFIYITHELADAEMLSTVVWIMDRGRIVQTGTLEEIRKNPKTYKSFVLVNGGNINEFQVTYKGGYAYNQAFKMKLDKQKKDNNYTLCITNKDVVLDKNGPIKGTLLSTKITPQGFLLNAKLKDDSLLSCLISEDEEEEYEYKEGEEISFSFPESKTYLFKARN